MIESIRNRVLAALRAQGALGRVGVACSGGPDSMVLADAVMALHRRGLLGRPTLLHVDHGLRPGSDSDADLVRAAAATGGADVETAAVQVDRRQASLEDAARRARYAALEALAAARELRAILTAHTASDQAETVLMRVVRGTGVAGLAGIPVRRGRYLRPLLGTTRGEIEAYVTAAGLRCVADPMNADSRHFRNRVRARLLPALRHENPRLDDALCRLARASAEQAEALAWAAGELWRQVAGRDGEAVVLSVPPLAAAPAALAKQCIARAAEQVGAGPLGARHLDAVWRLLASTEGSRAVDLPGALAAREYDCLRLTGARRAAPARGAAVEGPDAPYTVRRWRPGDRMRPTRLNGRSRKLSDLYGDARVPRRLRAQALVIEAHDGEIVWAEHLGPAHRRVVSVTLTGPGPVASNKVSD